MTINPLFAQLVEVHRKRAAEAASRIDWDNLSAEEFIESHDYCGVPISPAQRAFVRAADGQPVEHLDALDRLYHFGTSAPMPSKVRPGKIPVRGGRRCGKSLLSILLLCRHAFRAKLRREPRDGERPERDGKVGVGLGERVRLIVVAARVGQAIGTFMLALERLKQSPKLARYVESDLTTRAFLRRDDGQRIEVEILAAAARGANLRSGWFIGCLLDEADFFGEQDAAVTLQDQLDAVEPALVDDGQIFMATSPWNDTSQFARMHAEAWGHPGEGEVLAFHSSTQRMNPTYPVERIERRRLKDPDFVSREYDAVPMTASGDQFFPEASIIAACTRDVMKLEPNGAPHWAGADPGLRKNSATLALARRSNGKAELAYYEEMIPERKSIEETAEDVKRGIPPGLAPSVVFKSFAATALAYQAECIKGDQYYEDSAIEHMPTVTNARADSVYYSTVPDNLDSTSALFTRLRTLLNEGKAILPRDQRLMQQLRDTRTKRGPGGKIVVVLPNTGAAHGDLLKAVVLAMVQVPLELEDDTDETPSGA